MSTKEDRARENRRLEDRKSRILGSVSIMDVLHALDVDTPMEGNAKIKCISPEHDERTGSMKIYHDTNTVYCFGCLDPAEPIWTSRGLIPIGDVVIGDKVLSMDGTTKPVSNVWRETGARTEISLYGFRNDPLVLTSDHHCLVVRKEAATVSVPMLFRSVGRGVGVGFYKRKRVHTKGLRPIEVAHLPARSVSPGDFILFPVIEASKRNSSPFLGTPYQEARKGPRPKIIKSGLPVTKSAAYLYGLWLAEGSRYRGGVTWSLHINEGVIASEIQTTLKNTFGLESTINLRPESTQLSVTCSNSHLEQLFTEAFGTGCANKRLPPKALWWPADVQLSVIKGWLDGDACKNQRVGSTTSKELAYSMFALGVQCGLVPSLSLQSPRLGRLPAWSVSFIRERVRSFFHPIGDTNYLWLMVSECSVTDKIIEAVDITVDNTHTFVTKLGAVHNCHFSGNVVEVVRKCGSSSGKTISLDEALSWLEDRFKLAPLARTKMFSGRLKDRLSDWKEAKKVEPAIDSASYVASISDSIHETWKPYGGEVRTGASGWEEYIWDEFDKPEVDLMAWYRWAHGIIKGVYTSNLQNMQEFLSDPETAAFKEEVTVEAMIFNDHHSDSDKV